jgi:hypothetical protein
MATTDPQTLPPSARCAKALTYRVIGASLLLCFFTDVIMVGMGPMFVRMEELSVCRAHYLRHNPDVVNSHGDVEEALCKITEVQAELAYLSGWLTFFETVPGTFGSFIQPLGWRADNVKA